MARPVVSAAAERLYANVVPYQDGDEAGGWLLLLLCEAAVRTVSRPNEALRHDDKGSGWRRMYDPARCPAWALPWLAQHVGIPKLPPNLTEAAQRSQIAGASGLHRGMPAAMIANAKRHLTGRQIVVFHERDGGPWNLTVRTRTSETPDPDRVEQALLAQKPIGIVLSYEVVDGQTWDEIPAGTAWDDAPAGLAWDELPTTPL